MVESRLESVKESIVELDRVLRLFRTDTMYRRYVSTEILESLSVIRVNLEELVEEERLRAMPTSDAIDILLGKNESIVSEIGEIKEANQVLRGDLWEAELQASSYKFWCITLIIICVFVIGILVGRR